MGRLGFAVIVGREEIVNKAPVVVGNVVQWPYSWL